MVWRMGLLYVACGVILALGGLQLQAYILHWIRLPAWWILLPLQIFGAVAAAGIAWLTYEGWKEGVFSEHHDVRIVVPYITPPVLVLGAYALTTGSRWEGFVSAAAGLTLAFCGWKAMTAKLPEDPADAKPWL